jgi:xylan 1,4-beta-xylosidase
MTSYWCFSDVFEEQGVVKTPFYGGYGLIAERHIPKSAFWAFQMLHNLGTTRLLVDSENALVTKRADGVIVLALWNYAEPGQSIPNRVFHLAVQGSIARTYRLQMIDANQGSGLKAWQDIGAPVSPTPEQVDAIRRASMPKPPQQEAISTPVTVPRYGLALVEIEPGR